ncbi:alpha/beta-hydrolase [Rhizopogon salebrosus TDB-379]|nr:alpha/beta-hydrolase [Rhizopogon salebrosus TDB-379]
MSADNSSGERYLALPRGRTLAYEAVGNTSSKTVFLYLHGSFAIGDASKASPMLLRKNIHFIMPTLPGWGNTSPPPPSTSYNDCLTSDMTTLLSHHYPDSKGHDIKLYIAGSSFGTVPTQILYGAPYDKFPFGRCIAGVLLMGAFSPFRYHKDYAKCMTWSSYIVIGPVGYYMPFNLMGRLVKFVLTRKGTTIEDAETSLRENLFDRMDQAERETFERWCEERGRALGETERGMAENLVKSVSKSWVGFMLMSPVLHSDWGFRPDELDEEHSRPHVLITASKDDHSTPPAYAHYLAANYKNVRIKYVDGGHMSLLYYLNEVWAEFLADEQ